MEAKTPAIEGHRVVAHDEWIEARRALLAREKELTRLREDVARLRRALPWEKVAKAYAFDTDSGRRTLAGLFGPHSQLVVYHFMFHPDWDEGCKSCSFWADNYDGIDVHLAQRDVAFLAVSRAPLAKLKAYRARMGWSFAWVSSFGSDFNHDFGVSFTPGEQASGSAFWNYERQRVPVTEMPGVSVFFKDAAGQVFHTYSCYARGLDPMNGAYQVLDLVPKGRDEAGLAYPQAWVKRHDEYGG